MTDMRAKSYWQSACVDSDRSKDAIRSWFHPLSEGMTPYKAEILCEIDTDREKKIRAFMTDESGAKFKFERTMGRRFSISRKPIAEGASPHKETGGTNVNRDTR